MRPWTFEVWHLNDVSVSQSLLFDILNSHQLQNITFLECLEFRRIVFDINNLFSFWEILQKFYKNRRLKKNWKMRRIMLTFFNLETGKRGNFMATKGFIKKKRKFQRQMLINKLVSIVTKVPIFNYNNITLIYGNSLTLFCCTFASPRFNKNFLQTFFWDYFVTFFISLSYLLSLC